MMRLVLLTASLMFFTCFKQHDSELSFLGYKLNDKKVSYINMPDVLREISGIAVSGNKLFAHNDEKGIIYQVDINSGKILKRFSIGNSTLYADFEDIAIAGKKFYIVTSDGTILEFNEAADKSFSDFKKYRTGLSAKDNIEGLCYDDETNSLLLACKGASSRRGKDSRNVYTFSLKDYKLNPKPRFSISIEQINSKLNIKRFAPSGIRKNPKSKNFFIISARENAIIEVSPKGELLNASLLNNNLHAQPEGIEFTNDLTLLISDEGGNGYGKISKYTYQK